MQYKTRKRAPLILAWSPFKQKKRYKISEVLDELVKDIKLARHDIYWLEENEWAVDWEERMREAKLKLKFLENIRDKLVALSQNQNTISATKLAKIVEEAAAAVEEQSL